MHVVSGGRAVSCAGLGEVVVAAGLRVSRLFFFACRLLRFVLREGNLLVCITSKTCLRVACEYILQMAP